MSYIKHEEAIFLHTELMKEFGVIRCGLRNRNMLESALTRPQNSAIYVVA